MKKDALIMSHLFGEHGSDFANYEDEAYRRCCWFRNAAQELIFYGKIYEVCLVDAQKVSELIIKLHQMLWREAAKLPNFTLNNAEPGFSYGHFGRDDINLFRLECLNEVKRPSGLFLSVDYIAGLIASIAHDFGRVYINRPDDGKRVVKTSEVSGLILSYILSFTDFPVPVKIMAVYGTMANAHLTSSTTIKCEDGVERETFVYPHRTPDGHILASVKLPRNVHRLDCMGASFAARHFLSKFNTVDRGQLDSIGAHTYLVDFAKHMQLRNLPIAQRREQKLPSTMIEHLSDFAFSQSPASNSPYVDGDDAQMVVLRDEMVTGLHMILNEIDSPTQAIAYQKVISAYELFLWQSIDHSPKSVKPANDVMKAFKGLADDVQRPHLHGFDMTMIIYNEWLDIALADIIQIDPEILNLDIGNQKIRDIFGVNM